MMDRKPEGDRLIGEPEVKARTDTSRAYRWRLERDDKFPRRVKVGARAVRWRLSEIEAWIAGLGREPGARPPAQPPAPPRPMAAPLIKGPRVLVP